jgi:hypothetical protein
MKSRYLSPLRMSNNENSSQLKSSIDESLMNNEKKRKNKSL